MAAVDPPKRRRWPRVAAGMLVLLAAAIGALWSVRRGLAGWAVDRELAAAGVPGRYRLAAIGPGEQVIEDVVLGDPAHPDLVARRLVLDWRYGLGWPRLAAVAGDGVRLRGVWAGGRLSLGALDRLLPTGRGGGAALPDVRVTLRDARASLRLPSGEVGLDLAGAGNLRDGFRGTLGARAAALALGGCIADAVAATAAVSTANGQVRLRGPATLGQLLCPDAGLRAGAGRIVADVRLGASFDRAEGFLAPVGFPLAAGPLTLGAARGRIAFAATPDRLSVRGALAAGPLRGPGGEARMVVLDGQGGLAGGRSKGVVKLRLAGARVARPIRAAIAGGGAALAGTPLAPIGSALAPRLARLLDGAELRLPLAWAGDTLRLAGGTLRSGAATAMLDGTIARAAGGGWRGAARVSGAGLPSLRVAAAANAPGWTADVRVAPIRAVDATLTLAPLAMARRGGTIRFATAATLTGPLAGGRVEGLVLPVAGTLGPDGALRVGEGCVPLRFARLAVAGARLDAGALLLCGDPVLARRDGRVRLRATATAIAWHGRSGDAPLALGAIRLALADSGFTVDGLDAQLGAGADPTRLTIARLVGEVMPGGIGGRFEAAAGSIANVPLALSGASGSWRLAAGALRLGGGVSVADRGAPARFRPLASDDLALTLDAGRVVATGSLHLPGRAERIADVRLVHDVPTGTGGATLAVPGIPFARRGLQPEMLTPLTLGVVANVVGTVRGEAAIGWSAAGTTSTGTFATDRLDLAAAFGPVSGLAGTLVFTDLLGLASAPHQTLRIAEVNPGVAVTDGVARYALLPGGRIAVEEARWPFAGGALTLAPTTLDFAQAAERRLTFAIAGLDAARFLQQLDLPNISATGTFDGQLPMVFDDRGGRIVGGGLASRGAGTLAYVGELSNAQLGTMGKLAFDALKAIRYNRLDVRLDGRLDGEMVSLVRFDGVRQATGEKGLVARAIRNLPFRFNIAIRAPFRGLAGTARSYADPSLLLPSVPVQPGDSGPVR